MEDNKCILNININIIGALIISSNNFNELYSIISSTLLVEMLTQIVSNLEHLQHRAQKTTKTIHALKSHNFQSLFLNKEI